MTPIYLAIRRKARQIADRYPPQAFYRVHARAHRQSCRHLGTDPVIRTLKSAVEGEIDNDFGHGMIHAVKVAEDAGTLLLVEARKAGYPEPRLARRLRLVHAASLLHDIRRKRPDHAVEGAEHARLILAQMDFDPAEIADMCHAIRNHEAFKAPVRSDTAEGELLADCLYDADKFRWGPDNFKSTIWEMIAFAHTPLPEFVRRYPKGMAALEAIKTTFRTPTGQRFGPQFIDDGIAIGEQLYAHITAMYADHL